MRRLSMYIMALLYFLAGVNHLWHPDFYLAIMPPWLPWPQALVLLSGLLEMLLGVLLFIPATRKMAAWGIILLLIAVFPANIQMLLNYLHQDHPGLWLAILRLPVQFLLIWWAYGFTK